MQNRSFPERARVADAVDVDLQLGQRCTNRCVFCASGRVNEAHDAGFICREELFRALADGAAHGARRIILCGGEPTIHPDFFDVLRETVRLHFGEVVIFTNGAMLPHSGFLDRVADIGGFSWRVSIQGPDAAVHDCVTQHPGSFDRLVRGLDLLAERGQSVTANTCATIANVDSLPRLPALAKRHHLVSWHVDAVRPDDMGDTSRERLEAVLVPYRRLADSIRGMLAGFAKWEPGFDCSVGGVPFCLLPEWGHRIEHSGQPTIVHAIGRHVLGAPRDKYSVQLASRTMTASCEGCAFDGRCRGIPALYLDLFGDGEIAAIPPEELTVLDRDRNNLPLLLRAWLDRLLAFLPAPWRAGARLEDFFQRKVDVRLMHSSGGGAVLRVVPPAGNRGRSNDDALRIDTPECTLLITGDGAETAALHDLHRRLRRSEVIDEPQLPVARATGGAPAKPAVARIDLKIAFDCNNRCEFCVQGNKREQYGARSLDQIKADLEDGRRRGAAGVVFTGGEPTLQPLLIDGVRIAASLGYRSVQIQSNGRMFAHRPFCEQVVAAGANEFALAVHGAHAVTHDRLTRAPGSFRQVVTGIQNLTRMGQRVFTNTVITSLNYRELPDIARLLVGLGVTPYQFAFVHILGTAAANVAWLVPRKSEVMPWVRAGLDVGRRAGVQAMTEAIPFCFMQGYEECVAEQIIPRTTVFDADFTVDDFTEYRRNQGKARGPECGRCAYFERCEGPWAEYIERFGWSEFQPVLEAPEAGHAS